MDSDDFNATDGIELAHQNGDHKPVVASGVDRDGADDVNGTFNETARPSGDSESIHMLDESVNDNAESKGLAVSKCGEGTDAETSKLFALQKAHGKSNSEEPSNPKMVSSTGVKKSKDGKIAKATSSVSNGSVGLDSHSQQSLKSRSFNDRKAQLSKLPGKSDTPSREGLVEKTKSKPLKIGHPEKDEKVLDYKSDDAQPRRTGALPNYGFSFRCDERAEKRREFYSKLEEKVHAKEVEETNLQAKSKETREAEIKMFRKSLNFKATPMPSFYQEPPPPKVELKKIPTTRAKSPKLGRRKSSTPVDSEENSAICQSDRLSLDSKGPQSNTVRGISPLQTKKPQRKSLPKLPSEKTSTSNFKKEEKITSSKATNEENTNSANATKGAASTTKEQEPIPTAEQGGTQPQTDEGLVFEEHTRPILVQEPIALEN